MALAELAEKMHGEAVQTEEDKKIASHVRQLVEESRNSSSRMANESTWMTNIAYLTGFSGVTWNQNLRQFQPVNRPFAYANKNRSHVNKILPTIQNRLARLCKSPPKYDVRPESNSNDDKDAARLALQTLTSLWEKLKCDQKRLALYMWVQQAGHGWVKVLWDDLGGELMSDPIGGESSFSGDVAVEVVSPFEIFADPQAKSEEEALKSWLIQAKMRKLGYFKERYPEKGHLVKEEDAWLLSMHYEQRANNISQKGPTSGGQQLQFKNSAVELVKYEAPSVKNPKGRMIVTAGGILLEDKPLPIGEIPFRRFDDVIIAGKFFPEAVITHLRPIQDMYNETVRKRHEWLKKTLAGKYAVPRGAGLSQESLNDESGEIIEYTPVPNAPNGGQPVPFDIPAIPSYAYNEEERLTQMINDISGISEISRGTIPAAGIPAVGMALLTEQDDTRIGVMTEQHEHSWAGVGSMILKFVEKYYTFPRKLKMAGKGMEYAVKEVSGQDLRGNTDVIVIRGSTLPGSKVVKRQDIISAYQMGLLGDPADPSVREKVLSMIEFGDVAEVWKDYGLDMAQFKRVQETVENGDPVEVSEFDNHNIHLQEWNRYRKGDKWEILDPATKTQILQIMEAHIGFLTSMMGAPEAQPPGEPPAMIEEPMPVETGVDETAAEQLLTRGEG